MKIPCVSSKTVKARSLRCIFQVQRSTLNAQRSELKVERWTLNVERFRSPFRAPSRLLFNPVEVCLRPQVDGFARDGGRRHDAGPECVRHARAELRARPHDKRLTL